MDERVIARFWAKVDRNGPTPSHCPELGACWVWMAGKSPSGYGTFRTGPTGAKMSRAHRFSWALENGPIPEGLCALHKCDRPSCVRVSHLFLGTHLDNAIDRGKKGRAAHNKMSRNMGVINHNAKMTDDSVRELRALCADGLSLAEAAARFGITKTNACYIVHRKSWRHVL